MNRDEASNKHFRISPHQQQSDDEIVIRTVNHVVWSIECTIEELELDLSRVVENITSPDSNGQMKTLTVHKYYQQAKDLAKWISISRPVPEFVINARDLSNGVIEELESRIDDLPTLSYILKQAVGRLFENLGHTYYHLSIARNLRVRIEP